MFKNTTKIASSSASNSGSSSGSDDSESYEPTLDNITKSLLRNAEQIQPHESSQTVAWLIYEFVENYREHSFAFTQQLELVLNNELNVGISEPLELEKRINALHFILFKIMPEMATAANALILDGMISKALVESIEKSLPLFDSQDISEHPKVAIYKNILNKLQKCRHYNTPPPIASQNMEHDVIEVCAQLFSLGGTTEAEAQTIESETFLTKNATFLQNPQNIRKLIKKTISEIDYLHQSYQADISDSNIEAVILKLDKHTLSMNVLYFMLFKIIPKEDDFNEINSQIMIRLNSHAYSSLENAMGLFRSNNLNIGQNRIIVSKIRYAHKVLCKTDQQTSTLFDSAWHDKKIEGLHPNYIAELKRANLEHFKDRIYHAILCAEFLNKIESTDAARNEIDKAIKIFVELKKNESRIRKLKLKTKTKINSIFINLEKLVYTAQKKYALTDSLSQLLSEIHSTIVITADDYAQILDTLKNNLQSNDGQKSTFTLERFTNNLALLTKQTSFIYSPQNPIPSIIALKKHLEQVFFILSFLKKCHSKEEALILLPKVSTLLYEIKNKLNVSTYPIMLKLIAEVIDDLFLLTCKAVEQIKAPQVVIAPSIQEVVEDVDAKETPVLLNTDALEYFVNALFERDLDDIDADLKFQLLFNHRYTARQILVAVNKRMGEQTLPEVRDMSCAEAKVALEQCQIHIKLSFYLIGKTFDRYPQLTNERSQMLGLLFSKASYYFTVAAIYFKLRTDYTSEDAVIYATLQIFYQELERLYPAFKQIVVDLKNNSKGILSSTQQEIYNDTLWAAYHNLLKYKLYYASICAMLCDFPKASAAVIVAKQAMTDVNDMKGKLNTETLIEKQQQMLPQMVLKIGEIAGQIKAYELIKKRLSKPDTEIIVYALPNGSLQGVDPKAILELMIKKIKNVQPDARCAEYDALSTHFSHEINAYRVRFELIKHIFDYDLEGLKSLKEKIETTEARLLRINRLQENINVFFFLICTIGKVHNERFPNDEVLLNFHIFITNYIYFQANEIQQLLESREISSFTSLYKQILRNYQLFYNHIMPSFESALLDRLKKDMEKKFAKFNTLFQMQIHFAIIFDQFANNDLSHEACGKADSILTLLRTHNLPLDEISEFEKLLETVKNKRLPNADVLQLLHEDINTISPEINSFLNEISIRRSHHLTENEEEQKLLQDFSSQIEDTKENVVLLLKLLLRLDNKLSIDHTIILLEKIREHFKRKIEPYAASKIAIHGLIGETLNLISENIENCVILLKKQSKQLHDRKAQQQKRELEKIQKQIQKNLRKEEKKARQSRQQQGAEITKPKVAPQAKRYTPPSVARLPKREKQVKTAEISTDDEVAYYNILEETQNNKLSKKELRQQQKAKKLAQEQARKREAEYQAKLIEDRNREQAEKQMKLEEKRQRKTQEKQKVEVSNQIFNELVKELIAETAQLSLKEAHLFNIQDKISILEQFFTKDRLSREIDKHSQNLPDEAFKVHNCKIQLDHKTKHILELFHLHGIKAYVYGGYTRDKLLNRPYKDGDIVAFCTPEEAQRIFGEHCVINANNSKQLVLDHDIDIRCEQGTIQTFAGNLDITANALFSDRHGNIYDPLHAISDLNSNELHAIGNTQETFAHDPRRMFRIIRQSHELEKRISNQDIRNLKQNIENLTHLRFNEYRKQFLSLFLRGKATLNFRFFSTFQLLDGLLPLLARMDYSNIYVQHWIQTQCTLIDNAPPLDRENEYPFYKILAILLAPKINTIMNVYQGQMPLHDTIYQTIDEFFSIFKEYQPTVDEITFMAEQMEFFYYELLNHHHALSVQLMSEAKSKPQKTPPRLTPHFNRQTMPAYISQTQMDEEVKYSEAYRKAPQ